MADPVTLSLGAMAVGSVLSAGSQIQGGNQARGAANYQADQMDQNAGQQQAVAQRQAIAQRQSAALANSRLQAVAAASGAGAADATTINLAQGIESQGEYNALSSLYDGDQKAQTLHTQADLTRLQGKQAKKASVIGAVTSVLSTAGTAGLKYGGAGFGASDPTIYNATSGSSGAKASYYPNSGSTVTWR